MGERFSDFRDMIEWLKEHGFAPKTARVMATDHIELGHTLDEVIELNRNQAPPAKIAEPAKPKKTPAAVPKEPTAPAISQPTDKATETVAPNNGEAETPKPKKTPVKRHAKDYERIEKMVAAELPSIRPTGSAELVSWVAMNIVKAEHLLARGKKLVGLIPPGPDAMAVLMWATSSPGAKSEFMRLYVTAAAKAAAGGDEERRYTDDGRATFRLIDEFEPRSDSSGAAVSVAASA